MADKKHQLDKLISDYENELPKIAVDVSMAKAAAEGKIRELAKELGYKVSFNPPFQVILIEV